MKPTVLIIDNYDSFTFNLYHLIEPMVKQVTVQRNDNIDFDKVHDFDKVILSPGPGLPSESSMLMPFIEEFHDAISILGVCLGHQAIGQFFGCQLLNLSQVKHGEDSVLDNVDDTDPLFDGLDRDIQVGHYHSWVLDSNQMGRDIRITSKSGDLVMSIRHTKYDIKGVQFHPESILTPGGSTMLKNWLTY